MCESTAVNVIIKGLPEVLRTVDLFIHKGMTKKLPFKPKLKRSRKLYTAWKQNFWFHAVENGGK